MDNVREQISKLNSIMSTIRDDISRNDVLNRDTYVSNIASYEVSTCTIHNSDDNSKFIRIRLNANPDINFMLLNNYHQVRVAQDQVSYAWPELKLSSVYLNGMHRTFHKPICSITDLEEYLISDIESSRPRVRRYCNAIHQYMYRNSLNEYCVENLSPLTNGIFTEYTLFLDNIPDTILVPKVLRYELKYTNYSSIYTIVTDK